MLSSDVRSYPKENLGQASKARKEAAAKEIEISLCDLNSRKPLSWPLIS